MKLFFFLVAFCLVSIRFYLAWSGKDEEKRGVSVSNMTIKSDGLYEQIKYSGKFQLSEDERSFKSISPGGYFKYRKNDIKVEAESNLRGAIDYSIYDGEKHLTPDEGGKLMVTQAIREMIDWGYDAEARMERVYQKGGAGALLSEVDSMKTDQVKIIYLNRLFAIDSLLPKMLSIIIKKVGSMGSDQDKMMFLKKLNAEQLRNAETDSAYFVIVEGIGSDMEKVNALQYLIKKDSVNDVVAGRILSIGNSLGSDMDKANVFNGMIEKGLIRDSLTDSLMNYISYMGSDMDKVNLYSKLINTKDLSEGQWLMLEAKVSVLGSDMDKTNMLVEIAKKMHRTEMVRAGYIKAAKSINNDSDYGKVIRAVD
jgi:hypothetical protein